MYPENFRYTKEHEWVLVEGETGTIGITDHAQEELGDIVYVDLPKPGARLEPGKSLGSVESVKAVSDVYSPVAGEGADLIAVQRQLPNLVIAGHRDQQILLMDRQCPRAAERSSGRLAGPMAAN